MYANKEVFIVSNINDFEIKNGVLKKYRGNGGDVVVPEGVKSIGNYAFSGCKSITSILIPEGATSIEGNSRFFWVGAFSECTGLTSIVLPKTLISIGAWAFYSCTSLTNIVIPDSVTDIGEYAFRDCICLADKDGFFIFKGMLLFNSESRTIKEIPGSITSIHKSVKNSFFNSLAIKDAPGDFVLRVFTLLNDSYYLKKLMAILTPSQIQGAAECMLSQLDDTDDAEMMDVFAKFIITFHVMLKDDTIKAIYRKMSAKASAEKAIKKMQKTGGLSEKLGAVAVGTAKPQKTSSKKPAIQKNSTASFLSKVKLTPTMVLENAKSFYSISSFPRIKYADGSGEADKGLIAWLLTAHETMNSDGDVVAEYGIGIRPEAAEAIAFLDKKSLQDALLALADENLGKSGRTKKMFLAYPICRYADEGTMEKLTKEAKTWRSSNSGNDAPLHFTAILNLPCCFWINTVICMTMQSSEAWMRKRCEIRCFRMWGLMQKARRHMI